MSKSTVTSPTRGWLKPVIGGVSILAGVLTMVFGLPDFFGNDLKYEKVAESKSGETGFPDLGGRFAAEKLTRYRIGRETGHSIEMSVAAYRDEQGRPGSAIIYSPIEDATNQGDGKLRRDLWKSAAEAMIAHTDENALFVAWWDDAQRIRFLAGRNTWVDAPVAGAFTDPEQKRFWQQAGGGFNPDETRLKQLARWLSMDADTALREMADVLPRNQTVYFLICVDDLARLGEIETLSGVKLPFEMRVFPQSNNIHAQISAVKRWAGEKGVGSYLVQRLPGGSVRVWRITTEEGVATLLARLLPFTTSLAKPLEKQSFVYQSGWGGYLSIYQWRR